MNRKNTLSDRYNYNDSAMLAIIDFIICLVVNDTVINVAVNNNNAPVGRQYEFYRLKSVPNATSRWLDLKMFSFRKHCSVNAMAKSVFTTVWVCVCEIDTVL